MTAYRYLLALVLAACSSDPEPRPVVAPPTLIPLLGDPENTGDPIHCAQLVTELVKHPNWSLQITDENQTHTVGVKVHDRYVVHPDGRVAWTANDIALPERALTLTPAELERIRGLGALSCEPTDEHHGDGERYFGVAWGQSRSGNQAVPMRSQLGVALAGIVGPAVDRYVAARLEQLKPLTIVGDAKPGMYDKFSKRTAVYHLLLAPGGMMTVSRGTRQLAVRWIQPREVVELADKFLEPRTGDPEDDWLRGTITREGRAQPFALTMPREIWGSLGTVASILDDSIRADPRHPRQ